MSSTRDAKNEPFTKDQVEEIKAFYNKKLNSSYKLEISQIAPVRSHGDWHIFLNVVKRDGGLHRRIEDIDFTVEYARNRYPRLESKFTDSTDLAKYFFSALRSEDPPHWAKLVRPEERKGEYKEVKYLSEAGKEAAKLEQRKKESEAQAIMQLEQRGKEIKAQLGNLKKRREEIDSQIGKLEEEQRDVEQKSLDLGHWAPLFD